MVRSLRAMNPESWGRWLCHLLILAFALRALIPAGFMPAFTAAPDGGFKVVICTSTGIQTLLLNVLDDGGAPPGQHSGQAGEACAFSGMSSVSLPQIASVDIAFGPLPVASWASHRAHVLPPVRAGPVLGSRGPPALS
ncbi:MAG: DUF2946 family protein [Hyphomicrobium sp.]